MYVCMQKGGRDQGRDKHAHKAFLSLHMFTYLHIQQQVFYDPKAVSYDELLSVFWSRIDPTIVRANRGA